MKEVEEAATMLGSQEKKKLVAFASRAAKQFPSNSLDKINLLKSYQVERESCQEQQSPCDYRFRGTLFLILSFVGHPAPYSTKGWIVGDMQISNLFTRGSVGRSASQWGLFSGASLSTT